MASFSAMAQITLEHAYTTNSYINVANIEGDGYKYVGIDTGSKNVQIFNTDHTLWKTINTSIPTGAHLTFANVFCTSKYLFNADNKIEIVICFYTSTGSTTRIVNEDGTIIIDIPGYYSYIQNVSGAWKMAISGTNIYSLPGAYSGLKVRDVINDASATLFPNPIDVSATLRYKLPSTDHTAQLSIYNSAGSMVKQVTISDQYNDITISKGDLPTGLYVYSIATASGTLINSKFEIR